jgi:hypothetical protein
VALELTQAGTLERADYDFDPSSARTGGYDK